MRTTLMLSALCFCWLGATAAVADAPPNIILCMADDQGWGDVAYNGNPLLKTPTLDEMAATGLRFDRFYAAAPVCSPTRGSVMTGRHPNRFACFSWGHELRPEEITLAEALKPAGYATGHFGKWHLGPVTAGSPTSPGGSGFDTWVSSPNFFENSPLLSSNGKVVKTDGEGSQVTVDFALEFIRAAAQKQQPFLAVIWFGSPHVPHIASEDDRKPYADQPLAIQNYLGEITAMDRAIGHLRKELRTLGVAENTLLWYTSDNGAAAPGSTGGLAGKKGTLLEGGIRVPAIIEWPAQIKSPRRTDLPCGSVDIFPTVLDLVGATVKEQFPLDGISLRPLLAGEMTSRTKPLGFWVYPEGGRGVRSNDLLAALLREQTGQPAESKAAAAPAKQKRDQQSELAPPAELPGPAAWIDGSFKLHRIAGRTGDARYTLYDLESDPNETTNIAAEQADRVARMTADLEAWQKSVVHSLNRGDYAAAVD